MNVEFINPFLTSLINVLQTMANLQLTPGKPKVKKDEVAMGDVSGLIGMVGPKTRGSFSITFDEGPSGAFGPLKFFLFQIHQNEMQLLGFTG